MVIGIDELAAFCKRKGFVYQSGEIYGGMAGFWDFGHIGVELKNNIKKEWWKFHVQNRDDIVGIDGAIITNPKVWEASGHIKNFNDVYVKCRKCKKHAKIDKSEIGKARCEYCKGEFEVIGDFNLMLKAKIGPGDGIDGYLRPETAQLIFADFKLIQENARLKLPFGIAQIGKAFRNEISPRDFLFRSREFEQMEIEYFVNPEKRKECPYLKEIEGFDLNVLSEEMQVKNKKEAKMRVKDALKKGIIKLPWHAYWLALETKWLIDLGIRMEKLRIRQHLKDERSHYATDTWDLEYEFPFGWKELEGIADRGNYDLSQHEKFSKGELRVFDEETKKKILPEVVCEPSLGVERAFLVFLLDAYEFDKKRDNVVLHLHSKLAPIKAGIFPIIKDAKMMKFGKGIFNSLKEEWNVIYDEGGSIGRRYSRADEIGIPMCVAIDEQSLKGKTVTIRDRDTTKQIRVKINDLKDIVRKVISGENLLKLGSVVKTRVK